MMWVRWKWKSRFWRWEQYTLRRSQTKNLKINPRSIDGAIHVKSSLFFFFTKITKNQKLYLTHKHDFIKYFSRATCRLTKKNKLINMIFYWLPNSSSYCFLKQSPTGKKSQHRCWYMFHTYVSWPVYSVSGLLIKCIKKNI